MPENRLASLCAVFFLLLLPLGLAPGLACSGDDELEGNSGNGLRRDAGAPDADEDTGPSASCPATPPRSGETCPSVRESSVQCSFIVRQCTLQGNEYDVTEDYCCTRGGVWDPCGMVDPCASTEPTPEPDAGI